MIEAIVEIKRSVPGPLSYSECSRLAEAAAMAPNSVALEVGHYLGLSTCVLLRSLPTGSILYTIDHHRGDPWVLSSDQSTFWNHVMPHIGGVTLHAIYQPFASGLSDVPDGIGFVFYDADHSEEACESFWNCVHGKLASRSILVFDDADWVSMNALRRRAQADGFVTRAEQLVRYAGDKNDSLTMTIEIMERG